MGRSPTTFSKEKPRPGPGRPKLTEEQKRAARLRRAAEYDYKMECRALMPVATDLLAKRLAAGKMKDPDLLRTFEALRDSVHGRPSQTITGPDGGPLVGTFTAIVASINGAKAEKLAASVAQSSNGSNGHGNGHEKL